MARILIIDDDALVRQTVRTMLGAAYEIEEAADGDAGLRAALRSRPDLALTDILMPNQDGIEFIIQLRRTDPGIKIVAMSGGGRFEPEQLLLVAKALGADDYLSKPFTKQVLLGKLAACLGSTAAKASA